MAEGLVQMGVRGWVERQVAYPRNFGRLLRLDGERRGEEAASQEPDECSAVHHSIT